MKKRGKNGWKRIGLFAGAALVLMLAVIVAVFSGNEEETGILKNLRSESGYIRTVGSEEYEFFEQLIKRDLEEEVSSEELERLTKEKINRSNAEFLLANQMGLCKPYSFESFQLDMEHENTQRKIKKKRNKQLPLWAVCILDALLIGVILVTFAFFHHVYPRMVAQRELEQLLQNTVPAQTEAVTQPAQTQAPTEATEPPQETTQPTAPDNRTEWQIKFADKFTEDVVMTENSYSSPEVSITIEKISTSVDGNPVTYYLADVYVASLDNFQTYTAYNQFVYYGAQDAIGMTKATGAIFAVNGDYLTVQKSGFVVRNSDVLLSLLVPQFVYNYREDIKAYLEAAK